MSRYASPNGKFRFQSPLKQSTPIQLELKKPEPVTLPPPPPPPPASLPVYNIPTLPLEMIKEIVVPQKVEEANDKWERAMKVEAKGANIILDTKPTVSFTDGKLVRTRRVLTKAVDTEGSVLQAQKPQYSYVRFGTIFLHKLQLQTKSTLNFKRGESLLASIKELPPKPVSCLMQQYVLNFLQTGVMNWESYSKISVDEKLFFEHGLRVGNLLDVLQNKFTSSMEKDNETIEFEELKERFMDGDDDPAFLRKFRRLIIRFINDGRLTNSIGTTLLMQVSAL
jgi:hypothetical protein